VIRRIASILQNCQSLLLIAGLAFALRLGYRWNSGEEYFWKNGYVFFAELAHNIAAGNGIALNVGEPTAFRVPGYPIFLAFITFGRDAFVAVAFWQSLVGAATVICAALIARTLFGNAVALIAAGITAIYPYYVEHDTALQETSLFTLLTAVGVLLLLLARRRMSVLIAAAVGLVFGLATLTCATLAPFAIATPALLVVRGRSESRVAWRRLQCAGVCAAVLAMTVAPWLVRSYALNGTPTLSGETGHFLWLGNNPWTFSSHYPIESIDNTEEVALEALDPRERAQLETMTDEVQLDRWYLAKALQYIREHPWRTIGNDARKLEAAFGVLPSPRHGLVANMVYALSYGPVLLLGLWGMWTSRHHWRDHLVFYALFVSFALVTAVFFGHTSYRAYLDLYLIVFAAYTLARLPAVIRPQMVRLQRPS